MAATPLDRRALIGRRHAFCPISGRPAADKRQINGRNVEQRRRALGPYASLARNARVVEGRHGDPEHTSTTRGLRSAAPVLGDDPGARARRHVPFSFFF